MDPERWRQIEKLYRAALEEEPACRSLFLAEACQADADLRGEVESLLEQTAAMDAQGVRMVWGAADELAFTRTTLKPGEMLGPYRILGSLGAGGMGIVYSAADARLDRKVAIKVAHEQFGGRFEREARAISALNHPNICTLYDIGPDYLVTELVEGETLCDWLKRAPSLDRCLEIAKQVLEALRAAHRAGVVHRDLKPKNVMVRFDGYVKVLDFGLAKRMEAAAAAPAESTATFGISHGRILGTVAYMSPEQILGQSVDQRTDLFAFGIVLYEMLTGRHPWPRSSTVDILHAILHDEPPSMEADCPGAALGPVVRRLLSKNFAERYASAEAVLEALATHTGPQASSVLAAPNSQPRTSIVVLPFVFLSDVEKRKALSLGFADALITMLGGLEDIAVLPTSAILNYSAGADPAQVCRDLGVRHVLQGNVQKVGSRWRVSIQIFDGITQNVSFSEKHDFEMKDVFDVQDEIGFRVVASLQSRFAVAAPKKTRQRYSSDPEAYTEFMAGLHESTCHIQATIESAVRHLTKAVELDPDFALAHATLSYTCANVYIFDPKRTWIDQASLHCERALALDPDLPEGHLARAWMLWGPEKNFQNAEAIAALEKVLSAQPNLERAHNRMSAICAHIGRIKEATIADERARLCNPKTKARNFGYNFLYGGDFARAEEAAKAWLAEVPVWPHSASFGAEVALTNRDLGLAHERLTAGFRILPDDPMLLSLQSVLHACRGEKSAALECVHKTLESPWPFQHIHHAYHQFARTYAALCDPDKAMAWLQRSAETGFPCAFYFRVDPQLANLRGLPAFESLLTSLERQYSALKIARL